MYPPIEPDKMGEAAIGLVSAVEQLVLVTKRNCNPRRLAWLEEATQEVVTNYEDLKQCIERMKMAEREYENGAFA